MPEQLLTTAEFAQSIKAKYPDYASVPDGELAAKMLEKYPEYRDRVRTADFSAENKPGLVDSALDTAKDVGIGAAKGLGNTIFGLGKAVHDYTPIGRISDKILPGAFDQRPPELEPTNTPQRVGYMGEQVGEFFLPVGEAGAIGKFVNAPRFVKATNVAKSGALTLAQGGSPTAAGVSAGLTAVLPGSSALRSKAAGALESSAEKSVAQALGATKEWAKDEAGRLAPQMLQRGIGGSRTAMLAKASGMVKDIGDQIGAAVSTAAAQGKTISGVDFVNKLADTRATLTMVNEAGKVSAIPGQEAAVKTLDKLATFVEGLGGDVPIEKAQALKVTWDHIVSKAGLFGPKSMASASDNAKAWAFREASSSMRKLIADGNPQLADLNKEFRFWKGLSNVLTATEARTQAQSGGLTSAITGAAGAAAGFASGDSVTDRFEKALMGGVLGKQVVNVVQSPAFRTQVSGPLKQALADALVGGSERSVFSVLGRITGKVSASAPSALQAQGK